MIEDAFEAWVWYCKAGLVLVAELEGLSSTEELNSDDLSYVI